MEVIIFGTGGHARSILGLLNELEISIRAFVDPESSVETLLGYPVYTSLTSLKVKRSHKFIVAIGDNARRLNLVNRLLKDHDVERFPSLVHPSAHISSHCVIGYGAVVLAGALVGNCAHVGRFCILNSQSSLDHDSTMKNFSSLAPGVIVGGNVTLGECSAIGIGAVIRNGVSIGSDTVVGAASYVHNNHSDKKVVWGSPAKEQRDRERGENYL